MSGKIPRDGWGCALKADLERVEGDVEDVGAWLGKEKTWVYEALRSRGSFTLDLVEIWIRKTGGLAVMDWVARAGSLAEAERFNG